MAFQTAIEGRIIDWCNRYTTRRTTISKKIREFENMRTTTPAAWLLLAPLVLSTPQVLAEVFKCTTADGKTSYSEKPCSTDGAKEAVVPILKSPPSNGPVRDWAAENAAVNARVQAAADAVAAARSANKASAPELAVPVPPADRALTPEEAEALQRAAAGSRQADASSKEAAAAAANADAAAAAAKADAAVAAAAKAEAAAAASGDKALAESATTAKAAAAAAKAAAATAQAGAANAAANAKAAAGAAAAARAKANGGQSAAAPPKIGGK